MEKKKIEGNLLNRIVLIAMVIAIALLILNNVMLYERGIKVAEAKELLKEQLRPAQLELVKITLENCNSCFDIEKVVDELKKQNVNITSEKTISSESAQGKEFIVKYTIKKLPTIIASGEINKSEQLSHYFEQGGEILENTFIYTDLIPPYLDVLSHEVKGKVQIKHVVDSSCKKCVNLIPISSTLQEQKVFIENEQVIEYHSDKGQELIKKFYIKEIPAVLISEEVNYYSAVKDALIQSGAVEKEGFYAIHSTIPPYRNLSQNKIIGLVDVVYLTKGDCSVCYNVTVNRDVLVRFGLALDNEKTYDIASPEGKQFVQKYNITKAPVIVLSPDAQYYSSFKQAWERVGTIENDGWFVMRNPEVIGTYWDLERKRILVANE